MIPCLRPARPKNSEGGWVFLHKAIWFAHRSEGWAIGEDHMLVAFRLGLANCFCFRFFYFFFFKSKQSSLASHSRLQTRNSKSGPPGCYGRMNWMSRFDIHFTFLYRIGEAPTTPRLIAVSCCLDAVITKRRPISRLRTGTREGLGNPRGSRVACVVYGPLADPRDLVELAKERARPCLRS